MRRELVEKMVDDVGREDPHPRLVRVFASIAVDLHVERENRSVLRGALQKKARENRREWDKEKRRHMKTENETKLNKNKMK